MDINVSGKNRQKDVEVFCCYAPKDNHFFLKLKDHLKPFLRRNKNVLLRAETDIGGGIEWKKEIKRYLDTAQVILLLMSPDFLALEYCDDLIKGAIERHERGEARVIPILLRVSDWQDTPLEKLRPLPTPPAKAITEYRNPDEAYSDVAKGIKDAIEKYVPEKHHEASKMERMIQESLPSPSELKFLSDGWVLRKQEYFERMRTPLTAEEVLFYFDGGIPDWPIALSSQIPRREMVSTLREIIEETYLTGLGVTILLGGGGEGKSTILRQVIGDLIIAEKTWNLLWHENENTSLSLDALRKLPPDKGAWLIASDDADRIAPEVFNAAKILREDGRKDIHFFLCCRQIDWIGVGADRYPWASHSKFACKKLEGLILKDARLIIDTWSQYGDKGLAKLANCSPAEAVDALMQKAQSELSKTDGSFLGAMLGVRYPGEALDDRVLALLTRIDDLDQKFHRELLTVYTYIVALHAENQLILSKDLLASLLSCSVGEVQQRFIGFLEREAAIASRPSGATSMVSSNKYIFARHKVIAETAVRILARAFHVDFDDVYETLYTAAIEMFKDGGQTRMPEIKKWRYLPRYFFENGKKDIAFRLGHLSLTLEPRDHLLVKDLSSLYQDDKQFELGAKVFRDTFEKLPATKKDTLYYHEWATAEGKAKHHAISAWLDGIALADGTPPPKRDDTYIPEDHIIIALDGMSVDFEYLFQQNTRPIFQHAWGTAVRLGLQLKGTRETEKARNRLERSYKRYLKESNELPLSPEYIKEGIIAAYKLRDVDLPDNVTRATDLTFNKLM